MRKSWLTVTAAVALLASCTPDDPTDIVIRRVMTWWSLDGSSQETPITTGTVDVLVPEGEGYEVLPVETVAPGILRLDPAPTGRFFVRVVNGASTSLVEASPGQLYLGSHRVGRPDAPILQSATNISIDASGLDAWQASDSLTFWSPTIEVNPSLAPTVTVGATSGTAAANLQAYQPMVGLDASEGDWAILTQHRRTDTAAGYWRKAFRLGVVRNVTTPAGQATSFGATVAAPSKSRAVRLDFRPSEFAPVVAASAASVTGVTYSANVGWHPLANVPGPTPVYRPNVVYVTSTEDVNLGTVSVPLPDESWGTTVNVSVMGTVASPGGSLGAQVAWVRYRGDSSTPALTPPIGPPRDVRVAGQALSGAAVTGVGVTPLVTWDAPSWGTPRFYGVTVWKGTTSVLSATTRGARQVRIPPGVLSAGTAYWVSVSATWSPNATPWTGITTFPAGGATTYTSATFTP